MTFDDFKQFLPFLAIALSIVSIYFAKINWLESNRPIMTAFIVEKESGNVGSIFNLIISNSGNRPAVRVRLVITDDELKKIIHPDASIEKFEEIASNFKAESEVPLVRNGEELTTSFGAYVHNDKNQRWLLYGNQAEINIEYQDLTGRSYTSSLPIKVYVRNGFGGGVWN